MRKIKKQSRNFKFEFCDDIPDDLISETIYIIGENKFYWALVFICPCGCGDTIQLNLLNDVDPNWDFSIKKKSISISPSVWRKIGCKSHFILRKSKIEVIKEARFRKRRFFKFEF